MFVVYERCAKMPSSCKAPYINIAVIEVNYYDWNRGQRSGFNIRRAKRIIADRGPFPRNGKTLKSGAGQARKWAQDLADQLNNSRDMATAEDIIGAAGSA